MRDRIGRRLPSFLPVPNIQQQQQPISLHDVHVHSASTGPSLGHLCTCDVAVVSQRQRRLKTFATENAREDCGTSYVYDVSVAYDYATGSVTTLSG